MPATAEFQRVEREYAALRQRLDAGQIDRAQFEAALNYLMLQDEDGFYWLVGADSGRWYVHRDGQWVEAEPPGDRGDIAHLRKVAMATLQEVPPEGQRSAVRQPSRGGGLLRAFVGVALLIVVVAAAYFALPLLFPRPGAGIAVLVSDLPTALLQPSDLPANMAPKPQDLLRWGEDFAQMYDKGPLKQQARVQNWQWFGRSDLSRGLNSYLLYPLSPSEIELWDAALADPTAAYKRQMSIYLTRTPSVPVIPFPEANWLGEKSIGLHMTAAEENWAAQATYVITRWRNVLQVVSVDNTPPAVKPDQDGWTWARILDERVKAALAGKR